ncbi:MAG: hypothetical protein ACRBCI_05745 [Cellvibrionaceae bacterium]
MKANTPPSNPLVDDHPADTLMHIQALLTLAQEFSAKNTEEPSITAHEARVHTGLYALLKTANEALDYEIERLGNDRGLIVVK